MAADESREADQPARRSRDKRLLLAASHRCHNDRGMPARARAPTGYASSLNRHKHCAMVDCQEKGRDGPQRMIAPETSYRTVRLSTSLATVGLLYVPSEPHAIPRVEDAPGNSARLPLWCHPRIWIQRNVSIVIDKKRGQREYSIESMIHARSIVLCF